MPKSRHGRPRGTRAAAAAAAAPPRRARRRNGHKPDRFLPRRLVQAKGRRERRACLRGNAGRQGAHGVRYARPLGARRKLYTLSQEYPRQSHRTDRLSHTKCRFGERQIANVQSGVLQGRGRRLRQLVQNREAGVWVGASRRLYLGKLRRLLSRHGANSAPRPRRQDGQQTARTTRSRSQLRCHRRRAQLCNVGAAAFLHRLGPLHEGLRGEH